MPLLGLNLGGILKKAKDDIGTIADAIIPGNQSGWHSSSAPAPTQQPSQQGTLGVINRNTNFGGGTSFAPPQAPQPIAPIESAPPVSQVAPEDPIQKAAHALSQIGKGGLATQAGTLLYHGLDHLANSPIVPAGILNSKQDGSLSPAQIVEKAPGVAASLVPVIPQVIQDYKEGGTSPADIGASTLIHSAEFGKSILQAPIKFGLGVDASLKDIHGNTSGSTATASDIPVLGPLVQGLDHLTGINLDPGSTQGFGVQADKTGLVPTLAGAAMDATAPLAVAEGIKSTPKLAGSVSDAVGGVSDGIRGAGFAPNDATVTNLYRSAPPEATPVPGEVKPGAPEIQAAAARAGQQAPLTDATNADVNAQLNEQIDAQKNRYAQGKLQRFKNGFFSNALDPLTNLEQAQHARAKAEGIKYRDLPASEKLTHLWDRTINTDSATQQFMKDTGVSKLIQRYGGDTPQGKEFMNYLNAKFALEVQGKTGKQIISGASPADLVRFARDYEARNPQAIHDSATVKGHFDQLIDKGVESGLIHPDAGAYVKDYYQNYVPLNRVFPEDLVRPDAPGGSPVGSIGRQTILQNIEGSDLPLDNTFGTISGRTHAGLNQINRNNLANLARKYVDEGHIKGDYLTHPEDMRAREVLKGVYDDIQSTMKQLSAEKARNASNYRVAARDKAYATKDATAKARELLRKAVNDQDAQSAIGSLKKSELLDIFKNMVEDPKGTGMERIRANLAKRGGKYAELAQKLDDNRNVIQGLKNAARDTRSEMGQLAPDSTTGRQTFSGVDGGYPFRIEVDPNTAKVLQGMDSEKLNTLSKWWQNGLTKPFQTFFTGFLNPAFAIVSGLFYDTSMSVINSPLGFKTMRPAAIRAGLESIKSSNDFQAALDRAGRMKVGGSELAIGGEESAAGIAADKNIGKRAIYDLKHPKSALHDLDALGGKISNANRTRTAKAHYMDAVKKGMNEDQAIAEAVQAYNNFGGPNFRRATNLARQINAVVPYISATQAGTRSFLYSLRNHPTAYANLLAFGVAPSMTATAANLSQPNGKAFYDDMYASNKGYLFQNNVIIVTPGAKKDPKTGQWTGIIKIPVAPELRPLTGMTTRQTYDAVANNKVTNVATYAGAIFDTITGQARTNDTPAVNMVQGLVNNRNPLTGNPIVDAETMANAHGDKTKEITRGTGNTAIEIGRALGVSPAKVQFAINQFGGAAKQGENLIDHHLAGNMTGLPEDQTGNDHITPNTVSGDFINRFVGGVYGKSDGAQFYQDANKYIGQINDPQDRKLAEAMIAKNQDKSFIDSGQKAMELLNSLKGNGELFNFAKQLDARERAQGKTGNPLFDLPADQQTKVLLYQSSRVLRDTKQDYNRSGDSLFDQLGLKGDWYTNYNNARNTYYDSLGFKEQADGSVTDKTGKVVQQAPQSLSGEKPPKMDDKLQQWSNWYNTLPSGTGARSAALKTEMGLQYTQYLNSTTDFANKERAALGLEPLAQGGSSSSGGYSSGYSSRGGSAPIGSKYARDLNTGNYYLAPHDSHTSLNPINSPEPTKGKTKIKQTQIKKSSNNKKYTIVPTGPTKL